MKLNIGDYVRTKNGTITKIEKVTLPEEPDDCLFVKFENEPYSEKYKPWQTIDFKSSPNIIDLIEEGDYVNNIKIDCKPNGIPTAFVFKHYLNDEIEEVKVEFSNEDIKSIVTKEQFESIKYKIGE